jgi:hypothetical protein
MGSMGAARISALLREQGVELEARTYFSGACLLPDALGGLVLKRCTLCQ